VGSAFAYPVTTNSGISPIRNREKIISALWRTRSALESFTLWEWAAGHGRHPDSYLIRYAQVERVGARTGAGRRPPGPGCHEVGNAVQSISGLVRVLAEVSTLAGELLFVFPDLVYPLFR
jgi:hypothetical protein